MAMQAATLEVLERADVPPHQARAIAQAIEIELAAGHATLATRNDLHGLGIELRHELQLVRSEFTQGLRSLRGELKVDLADQRSEFKVDLADLRSELVRWVFLCILGQTAALLGAGYFLLDRLVP